VLPRILALNGVNNERSTFCRLGGKKIRDPMRGPFGSLTALLSKTYLKKRFPRRFLPSSGALTLIAFRVPVAASFSSKFEHRRKLLLDSSLAVSATDRWDALLVHFATEFAIRLDSATICSDNGTG
jgi:hypothetical protein